VHQEFSKNRGVHLNRDDQGNVRDILHTDAPVVVDATTPQLAAADYLKRYGGLLGVQTKETRNLALAPATDATDTGPELRFRSEKHHFDMTTVTFRQTRFGLPVWHGGVSIHMKRNPYRVVSSQSTRHADLDVTRPSNAMLARLKKIDNATLAKQLGLTGQNARDVDLKTLKIESRQLLIYRYAAAKRALVEHAKKGAKNVKFPHVVPHLLLPPVAKQIVESHHYVAAEVNFALAPRGIQTIHWTAIVEAETLSVLYVRAYIDDVQGLVFQIDPITTNGGPGPKASNTSLNPIRTSVVLDGLTVPPSGPQPLIGNNVKLVDVELPSGPAPTEPSGTSFNFNARTNDFAAVNAYYHCDRFFRLMQDLGFQPTTFFGSHTSFPSSVDHRGLGGNVVNAHCLGTSGGLGILQTTFALADTADVAHPIGIACDYRVVLHELGGHGVLYPHVHSPNFGFSHSAGDSVAAITCDPDTHAPDRFVTFPWVDIGRRHDRTPAAGWGWGGNIARHPFDPSYDGGGYGNEQILSTTMFRIYRSLGGDSPSLATRQFAARFAVYLILRAINSLTPATNPSNAAGFATALLTADLGDWTSTGQSGGAYGKVIRWSFEKQGLYQPAGSKFPNNNVGAPPDVDVYIEDGRHGEYQFQENHWSCHAIWNRRHADGGAAHETPVSGATNYAYVKIKNRGTKTATNVVVKAFHANPAAGLSYPNDWQAMATAQLSAANVPPNSSAEITVGPFHWVPSAVGHECMFMVVAATGDPSNISNMTAGDSIPEWRLVPNDNNIGQRNVFPVPGAGGKKALLAALDKTKITIKNPFNVDAHVIIDSALPSFLSKGGWQVTFDNPGSGAFSMKPGESKPIVVRLSAGKEFSSKDVGAAKNPVIHIRAVANGIVVGGMSYELDPQLAD
jgi:hypothetical protein